MPAPQTPRWLDVRCCCTVVVLTTELQSRPEMMRQCMTLVPDQPTSFEPANRTAVAAMPAERDADLRRHKARGMLQAAGLRCTRPRVGVLSLLLQKCRPVTHAELARELCPESMDRATAYRVLIDLVDVGILVRLNTGDHRWRFEPASVEHDSVRAHPHFTCRDCGEVACLSDVSMSIELPSHRQSPLSDVRLDEVQLFGLCEQCLGRSTHSG